MKLRMIFIPLLILISCAAPAWADPAGNTGLEKDVKILYTSDVHCAIDQGWGYGGIYAVKQSLAEDYHVLLVDDGDAVQGEPVGLLTKGKAVIDIMNATGYDIAIPGNHEFDYGMENFLELADRAKFPYISCNFNKMGELVFGNYIYGFFQDETGEALYQAVQKAVDSARSDGADYVVVMGHLGSEAEVSPWTYADVISHTSGIDAWLDGHSHDAEQMVMKNKTGRPVYRSHAEPKTPTSAS